MGLINIIENEISYMTEFLSESELCNVITFYTYKTYDTISPVINSTITNINNLPNKTFAYTANSIAFYSMLLAIYTFNNTSQTINGHNSETINYSLALMTPMLSFSTACFYILSNKYYKYHDQKEKE